MVESPHTMLIKLFPFLLLYLIAFCFPLHISLATIELRRTRTIMVAVDFTLVKGIVGGGFGCGHGGGNDVRGGADG